MPDGSDKTATQAQLDKCADQVADNADVELKKTYSDKGMAYGSIYPMRASLIWAWLTRRHTQELQRMVKERSDY